MISSKLRLIVLLVFSIVFSLSAQHHPEKTIKVYPEESDIQINTDVDLFPENYICAGITITQKK